MEFLLKRVRDKKGIQTGNPYKVKRVLIYYKIPLDTKVEYKAHLKLNEYRSHGEWFKCDLSLVENAIERSLFELNIKSCIKLRYNEELDMFDSENIYTGEKK